MKINFSDVLGRFRKQTVYLVCVFTISSLGLVAALSNYQDDAPSKNLTQVGLTLPASGNPTDQQQEKAITAIQLEWKENTARKGDSLSTLFKRAGLPAKTLHQIMQSGKASAGFKHIKPGQKVRFGYLKGQLQQVQLYQNKTNTLIATLLSNEWEINHHSKPVETRIEHGYGIIKHSLFAAGSKAGLGDRTIMQMVEIFGWDIDFALDIWEGDSFSVIYETKYTAGEKIAEGSIIAAEFINKGRSYQAVRYTGSGGEPAYYAADGKAMRKAFLRTPVKFSRISSRFTKRRWHPVLKSWRSHKGVDYAAARGTPVRATSNGKIIFKGRRGGYGKVIFLQHGKKYTTVYGHLNGYAKGIRQGRRVKQGQVIGYVGSTGLATGPHLHYELRVNGIHRNPLTIKLPQASSLPKKLMADFRVQSQPLFNQLAMLSSTQLATTTPLPDSPLSTN